MSIGIPDFTDIRNQIAGNLVSVFGSDLNIEPNSPTGQSIDLISNSFLQLYQKLQAVDLNGYAQQAQAQSLDNLLTLISVFRDDGTRTRVNNVTISGTPGTIIPAGSACETSSGNKFHTGSEVTIALTGVILVDCFADEPGAIVVKPGELNVITIPLTGWTSITNGSSGITGLAALPDSLYRAMIPKLVNQYSLGYMGVIYAKIYQISTVIDAFIYENDRITGAPAPFFSPPSTLWAILYYEDTSKEQEIADNIFIGKPAVAMYSKNIPTQIIKTVYDINGYPHTISWNRAIVLPIYVKVKVLLSSQLTINVSVAIQNALVKYILDNRKIGRTLYWSKFLCVVSDIDPNIVVEDFWVSTVNPPTDLDIIDIETPFDNILELLPESIVIEEVS